MTKRYWESVSDAHLLAVELTTDDPEKLENLVDQLPNGPDESFVEYGYDLRKSERAKMRCTHCHQPHLAGLVINKAGLRFLVGHICGEHIYGANFEVLRKDYDAAVDRQGLLRRIGEIRAVVDPFLEWMAHFSTAKVFEQYGEIRAGFQKNMPWLWEQLKWHTNNGGGRVGRIRLPNTMFDGFTDPQRGFRELGAEISKLAMLIVGKIQIEKDIGGTLGQLQVLLARVEATVKQLEEVVQFFQPVLLGDVCDWATLNDRRRKYEAGLMSITCVREGSRSMVRVPPDYKIPNTAPIEAFRAAVSNLPAK
ncbi:hypothetical protein [Bradyrhizobium sp. LA6.7]|uniref:hypothetical protein n=1 Tax=unclassified Bradyrhizobium TaxID=2631580 RepID=UPI0033964293